MLIGRSDTGAHVICTREDLNPDHPPRNPFHLLSSSHNNARWLEHFYHPILFQFIFDYARLSLSHLDFDLRGTSPGGSRCEKGAKCLPAVIHVN